MSPPALLVSDVHLDQLDDPRTRAFCDLLGDPPADVGAVYLLGDIFELWIGDDDDDPLVAVIADRFRALTRRGVALHFMHGNRDFLLGESFCDRCGMTLLREPTLIERDGWRFVLCHGDALCTDDADYQQLRAVMRSDAWQRDMLTRPLEERRRIGAELRAASRAANENKASNIMDVNADTVAELIRSNDADWLIHGHTHRPAVHPLRLVDDEVERSARRLVLGDWNRFAWWGLISDRGASLHSRLITD